MSHTDIYLESDLVESVAGSFPVHPGMRLITTQGIEYEVELAEVDIRLNTDGEKASLVRVHVKKPRGVLTTSKL